MIRLAIVEDQEIIRQSLEMMLGSKSDIEIAGTAGNGEDAIKLVKSTLPEVVLMDIRIPGIDGVECTRIIKEKYPKIKVIILTTFDDDEYVFYALKYGASGYLLKGISLNELLAAIKTVVEGGALINPSVTAKLINYFSKMAYGNFKIAIDDKKIKELNKNEIKIMQMIGMGMTNIEISRKLKYSEGTIRNYISNILSKLNLRDRTQIAVLAVQTDIMMKDLED